MARAIIGGLVHHGVPGSDILVVNPRNPKSTGEVKAMYGAIPSAPEDIRGADTVVVAVKPQSFPDAAPAYRDFIAPGALVVTIMAGIGSATVEAAFPQARVVRVMPNIAMAVGCGASGVAPGRTATDADVQRVLEIFRCGGAAVAIDEREIDEVAALSGSGAAYIYLLVEALRDAAIEDGMAPEKAAMLARQTLIGAARQLEAEDVPPEELRRRITSKKGTTEAAIKTMCELGLPEAVKAGFRANKARSKELAAGAM